MKSMANSRFKRVSDLSKGTAMPILDDPFDGFFKKIKHWEPVKGGLLDNVNAKRWFKVVGWGSQTDLYTYQQRFDGKSGPRVRLNGQEFLMMSSYDYLGLIGHPAIETASIESVSTYGTGTGGVRLLTGTNKLHREFEQELAAFKGTEAAITFTSGYLANIAVISALLDCRDKVIIDSLAHRSIIDACRLARVPIESFCHNDPTSLRQKLSEKPAGRRTLIVVEGVYSMDGDICPLPEIVQLKNQYNAYLMVDEAHSFGVLGSNGRGVEEYFGLLPSEIDIWMGSLSKAIPSNGGFLAGSQDLIIYLQHGAAPFMFSAALCPSAIAAARESLRVLQREPERLKKLCDNAEYLRSHLNEIGYNTGSSQSHIIPVIAGSDKAAYQLARNLFSHGILASAVVFPAVPRGKARLRICATSAQSKEMLCEVLDGFERVRQKLESIKNGN